MLLVPLVGPLGVLSVLVDVGLLRAARCAIAPKHAPGIAQLSDIAGLEVTESAGPGAAVDIIDRILARIRDAAHEGQRRAPVAAEQGVG